MKRNLWAAVMLLLVLAGPARAQAAWDSPMLLPPIPNAGFGVFLMDAEGGGVGVLGLYRSSLWNYGLRAGIAESGRENRISVFGGVDYSGPITRETPDFPLNVDWVFGAGLSFDERVRVSLPLGLTTGRSFVGEGAVFTPYATPRIVLDGYIGGEGERRSALELAVDIGLDLDVVQGFLIRFGASLGRRNAVALGLFF
jgi:hypothetical protein